ncbi:MAG: phosphatidylglycerophosphatase A [Planctomycetota bacterium]
MNKLKLAAVSFFFLGCSPLAPGTVGTLGGVALAWALRGTENYLLWILLICALIYILGRALANWTIERYGEDPGVFVLDEVLGYLVTVAWVRGPSALGLALGFAVFRFLDVLKPPPIRQLEKIPGGDGILLDDLAAGLVGLAVMAAVRTWVGEETLWFWEASV